MVAIGTPTLLLGTVVMESQLAGRRHVAHAAGTGREKNNRFSIPAIGASKQEKCLYERQENSKDLEPKYSPLVPGMRFFNWLGLEIGRGGMRYHMVHLSSDLDLLINIEATEFGSLAKTWKPGFACNCNRYEARYLPYIADYGGNVGIRLQMPSRYFVPCHNTCEHRVDSVEIPNEG